jgi:pSer/pThr/pTyr-binding forkhead associated (FHA) protein
MAFLDILDGPARGRRFRLDRRHVMVGRDASCALRIPDGRVSRRHLQIVYDRRRDSHFALDIGSANGVTINDLRLVRGTERQLADGDEIVIGCSRLRYALGPDDEDDGDDGHPQEGGHGDTRTIRDRRGDLRRGV